MSYAESPWTPPPGLGKGSSESDSARMTPITPDSGIPIEQAMAGLFGDEDEDEDAELLPGVVRSFEGARLAEDATPAEEQDAWAQDEDEELEAEPEKLVCPVHGMLCKKGICSIMKKMIRAQERAREATQRQGKKNSNWRQEEFQGAENGRTSQYFLVLLLTATLCTRRIQQDQI